MNTSYVHSSSGVLSKSRQSAVAASSEQRAAVDYWLLVSVALLLFIGSLMVFSTTAALSQEQFGSAYAMVIRHSIHMLFGICIALLCFHVPLKILYGITVPMFVGSVLLLALVLIPGVGSSAGGAQRWIGLGALRMQPAELVKLTMVLYMSSYVARKHEVMGTFKFAFVIPYMLLALIAGLLLLQPDFGSTMVISAIVLSILLTVSQFRYVALAVGLALIAIPLLIVSSPYRFKRLTSFLDPFEFANTSGYQLIQSLIAVGSSGLDGAGWGLSKQKLFYLPAAHTDFIFAVLTEELGFMGGISVLVLFMIILWRGLSLSLSFVDKPYFSALSLGLTLLIVLPAMLNMGVVLGLLPTKGLVLPLIAYGGTSMVVQLAIVGLLLNVSRYRSE